VGALSAEDFERCIAEGGVALFPADTVYGLACDPESEQAVERLYAIKGRPLVRPAAVMFFQRDLALAAVPGLGPHTRRALQRLLPGPVTVLLPNPEGHFPLACGPTPERLGLRVPELPQLAGVGRPVLQSSANPSGGMDARSLGAVDERIREKVDLIVDGGELPGTASTVIDLTAHEDGGAYEIVREGALSGDAVDALLR
jgi:L-threonylcarbamoyladenylate synthase